MLSARRWEVRAVGDPRREEISRRHGEACGAREVGGRRREARETTDALIASPLALRAQESARADSGRWSGWMRFYKTILSGLPAPNRGVTYLIAIMVMPNYCEFNILHR
jgi:hypothetical protein